MNFSDERNFHTERIVIRIDGGKSLLVERIVVVDDVITHSQVRYE